MDKLLVWNRKNNVIYAYINRNSSTLSMHMWFHNERCFIVRPHTNETMRNTNCIHNNGEKWCINHGYDK